MSAVYRGPEKSQQANAYPTLWHIVPCHGVDEKPTLFSLCELSCYETAY
jgi:hypothetical protein